MKRQLGTLYLTIAVIVFFETLSGHAQANLIVNGSFESPAVPNGSYINYAAGSTQITGWTVVGVDSSVVNKNFTQSGVTFNSEAGNQWIDLAGVASNSMSSGVTQSVATVAGDDYRLTFYVGSSNALPFFFPATVDLSINGGARSSYFNPATPNNMLDWKLFTVDFTAAFATTNLAFLNGDVPSNFETPLDNVQLTDITGTSVVPEPSSGAIVWLGGIGLAFGVFVRKKQSLNRPGGLFPVCVQCYFARRSRPNRISFATRCLPTND